MYELDCICTYDIISMRIAKKKKKIGSVTILYW